MNDQEAETYVIMVWLATGALGFIAGLVVGALL